MYVCTCYVGANELFCVRLFQYISLGWTLTSGVESAYGSSKSYLEPLRTLYQGAEGIIWLAIVEDAKGDRTYLLYYFTIST